MLASTHSETHVSVSVCTAENAYPRFHDAILSTKYFDDETELVYYGYRYYSPEVGRWLSRDPIGEDGGEGLYLFCDNSPPLHVDSLGRLSVKIIEMPTLEEHDLATLDWLYSYRFRVQYSADSTPKSPEERKTHLFIFAKLKFTVDYSVRGKGGGDCLTCTEEYSFEEWFKLEGLSRKTPRGRMPFFWYNGVLAKNTGLVDLHTDRDEEICDASLKVSITYDLTDDLTDGNTQQSWYGQTENYEHKSSCSSTRFWDRCVGNPTHKYWRGVGRVGFKSNSPGAWTYRYHYFDNCCCGNVGPPIDRLFASGISN